MGIKQLSGYVTSVTKHNGFPDMSFEVTIRIPVKLPSRPKPPKQLSRKACEVAQKVITGRAMSLSVYEFDEDERQALMNYIAALEQWQHETARACDIPDLHIGPVAIIPMDGGVTDVDRERSGKDDN